MQLTPEDHAKLETKQIANLIRKLNSGKTLTAREQAILDRARAQPAAGVPTSALPTLSSAYAASWDDLAKALGVSRKSIQNWRGRPELTGKFPAPRADGRHDIAAWSRAMVENQLARADEDVEPETIGSERRTVTDWKMHREELLCTKLQRDLDKEDNLLLVAAELEVPLGATFAALQTKLSQFPARVARFVKGLRDEEEVESRLREEIDADLSDLQAGRFVNLTVGEILTDLPFDEESTRLLQLVTFAEQDRGAMLELIAHVAVEALRRIGRKALHSAITGHAERADTIAEPETGQVSDLATAKSATCRAVGPAAAATPVPVPPKAKRGRPRKPRPKPAPAPAEMEAAIVERPRSPRKKRR